jgi:CheY-like chemotaxis protein
MCESQTNIAKATRAQARIRNDQRKKKRAANAPALVALVDDEAAVRGALTRLIRSWGFRVEAFSLGREFLRSVANHKPDCVALDVHMPQMSGGGSRVT